MASDSINCKKSQQAFARACEFIPGGVNSPVRAFGGVDEGPLFIASAKGSKIYDIDGNEYIDYVCSWGPLILGHAHPKVIAAVKTAAERGTSFGAPTLAETALAEKIVSAFPSAQKVRMVSSGTEAVMTAIRLARAYTQRDYIIKMIGCYHGHSDSLLVAAGSGLAESSKPSSKGVPAPFAELTITVPFNDVDALRAASAKYKDKIAGVLVEPIAANMGVIPPRPDFLQSLRKLCDDNNTLLIFDEVITGFRVALGGAQQLYNIKSDLTCLGKIIGGGLPAAAITGPAKIMDLFAPEGPVYQAGTLSGNPLATAAAIATLDILADPNGYQQLENTASLLHTGLAQAAEKANIALTINRVGSIMSCFFTDKPVNNFNDVRNTNIKMFKTFFSEMLKEGIYLAPSAYEAMFISLAHSKEDIEKTIKIAQNVFHKIAEHRTH
jgi:glutamate-1-semialdehyde 2,1-aminomutase